jgi:hypothetical protein
MQEIQNELKESKHLIAKSKEVKMTQSSS